jgi:hypothetical protein
MDVKGEIIRNVPDKVKRVALRAAKESPPFGGPFGPVLYRQVIGVWIYRGCLEKQSEQ